MFQKKSGLSRIYSENGLRIGVGCIDINIGDVMEYRCYKHRRIILCAVFRWVYLNVTGLGEADGRNWMVVAVER